MNQRRPAPSQRFPGLRRPVPLRRLALVAGPLAALATYWLLPESYLGAGGESVALAHGARATAGIAVWMALWWMTEALPVYATALLPLALLPLTGAATMAEAASPYGHPLIYLFLGGFILALAMERWGLHRRIAFSVLKMSGEKPRNVVGGFMAVTAGLSMWVSNTATAVMMLPIALSVVDLLEDRCAPDERPSGTDQGLEETKPQPSPLALCLLLGIAYSASIGGLGTLVGTPPNLFLASYAESQLGIALGFGRWMLVGVPLVLVFLPLAWLLLTRVLYALPERPLRGGLELARQGLAELGGWSGGEKRTAAVFALTAGAWIFRPLLAQLEVAGMQPLAGLTDPGIAILAALALFMLPAGRDAARGQRVMDWPTAVKLPWGLLVLFGGGLSLAAALQANGVATYLGSQVGALAGLPAILPILAVTALMIFLTEITSNTASTAALVPVLAALAGGLGLDPLMLALPAAVAASCAFMLPVATPPNAIVFGSDRVPMAAMIRAGLWLNLAGVVLITLWAYFLAFRVLGIGVG
ncbi:MAG: DASS family sodium-coupled anion symporter [Acidobacteriota bacterium]|nr:DASS family sodium-coupled anion symporter [Acidobacteriota bacterium]